MLVLTRKANERIQIGEHVTVTVVRIADGVVRLGIEAPAHISVVRRELHEPADDASREQDAYRDR